MTTGPTTQPTFDPLGGEPSRTGAGRHRPAAVSLVHRLEAESALDELTQVGDRISSTVTANDTVRAALQGDALGHAVHPIAVMAPISTWSSATILDLVGGPESERASRQLTLLGILSSAPAAITGWAEYPHAGPRGRRVAVVHAAGNAAALGLQVASLVARHRGARRTGAVLGATAVSVMGVAGYLGGHLAAARHVSSHDPSFGPETPCPPAGPEATLPA